MSTSRNPAFSGPSKKISSWVRPGVLEVRASALRPVSALIRLDLPTLERPAKATSTPAIGGNVSIEGDAQMNLKSPANNLRPCSISFASGSAVIMRGSRRLHHAVIARSVSDEAIHSRRKAGLLRFARNDDRTSRLRFGLLAERRPHIVEQFDLHAIAAHDQALLQNRECVVPGPVDHETRREARQHESEDQRHPAEDHLLGRIWRGRVELELEPHRDAHDDRPYPEREVVTEQGQLRRVVVQKAEQSKKVGRIWRRQIL